MVAVAQLVEPQIVILVVVGSSPIGHPKRCLTGRNETFVPLLFSLEFKKFVVATIFTIWILPANLGSGLVDCAFSAVLV